MTETTSTSKPNADLQADDDALEQQFDQLAAQIHQTTSPARQPAPPAQAEPPAAAAPQPPAEAPTPEAVPARPPSDEPEEADDPLARQIQALLDQTRMAGDGDDAPRQDPNEASVVEPSSDPPTAAAGAITNVTTTAGTEQAMAAPTPQPVDQPEALAPGEQPEGESVSIDQLDSVIAGEADTQLKAQRRAVGEPADGRSMSDPDAVPDMVNEGGEMIAGAFAAPDDLLGKGDDEPGDAQAARGGGATAADVAAELDAQPELRGASGDGPGADEPDDRDDDTSLTAPVDDKQAGDAPTGRKLGGMLAAMRKVEPVALRCCGMLNAPLMKVSPQVRATIGYAALLTVFNAVVLMIFGLLF